MEDSRIKDNSENRGQGFSNAQYPSGARNQGGKPIDYKSQEPYSDDEIYERKRGRRAFSNSWNIVWSLVLIIFFNFYSSYIAYFQYGMSNGVLVWHRYSVLTADFQKMVPLITAGLIIIAAGSIILLILDKYILARVLDMISAIFAIAVLGNIFVIFPFDFNIVPYEKVAQWMPIILKVVIGIIILILLVQVIANFVKIVVKISRK